MSQSLVERYDERIAGMLSCYATLGSWSRERRVIGKAEMTGGEANPRFIVTSLKRSEAGARHLYENTYCARGNMENRIMECQLHLFADRTSTATMQANQLPPMVCLDGLCVALRLAPHRIAAHARSGFEIVARVAGQLKIYDSRGKETGVDAARPAGSLPAGVRRGKTRYRFAGLSRHKNCHLEDAPMIYEVRTYTLRPGTLAEFEERYAKRLPLREKHSKLGAFWHTEVGPLNQVIHVYPYDDLQQRTAVRSAMAQDTALQQLPGGRDLIAAQEAEIVIPAPFMRPLGSRDYGAGNIYEMRSYTFAPGDIPKVLDGWAKAIEAREQFSPLAACWTSELGGLNKFVHTWVYKDLNERARVREASRKPGGQWPPQTGVRPIRQENKLLIPAAFSPVR